MFLNEEGRGGVWLKERETKRKKGSESMTSIVWIWDRGVCVYMCVCVNGGEEIWMRVVISCTRYCVAIVYLWGFLLIFIRFPSFSASKVNYCWIPRNTYLLCQPGLWFITTMIPPIVAVFIEYRGFRAATEIHHLDGAPILGCLT